VYHAQIPRIGIVVPDLDITFYGSTEIRPAP